MSAAAVVLTACDGSGLVLGSGSGSGLGSGSGSGSGSVSETVAVAEPDSTSEPSGMLVNVSAKGVQTQASDTSIITFPSSSLWQTTAPVAFVAFVSAGAVTVTTVSPGGASLASSDVCVGSVAFNDDELELKLELNRFLNPLRGIVT